MVLIRMSEGTQVPPLTRSGLLAHTDLEQVRVEHPLQHVVCFETGVSLPTGGRLCVVGTLAAVVWWMDNACHRKIDQC